MNKKTIILIAVIVNVLIASGIYSYINRPDQTSKTVYVEEKQIAPDVAATAPPGYDESTPPEPETKDLPEARVYLSLLEKLQSAATEVQFPEVFFAADALVTKLRTSDESRQGGEESLPGIIMGSSNSEWVDKTEIDLVYFTRLAREKGSKQDQLYMEYLDRLEKSQWQKDSKTIAFEIFYVQCLNTAKEGLASHYKELSTKIELLKGTPYDLQKDMEKFLAQIEREDLCFCRSKAAVKSDLSAFQKELKDKKIKENTKRILDGLDSYVYGGECASPN